MINLKKFKIRTCVASREQDVCAMIMLATSRYWWPGFHQIIRCISVFFDGLRQCYFCGAAIGELSSNTRARCKRPSIVVQLELDSRKGHCRGVGASRDCCPTSEGEKPLTSDDDGTLLYFGMEDRREDEGRWHLSDAAAATKISHDLSILCHKTTMQRMDTAVGVLWSNIAVWPACYRSCPCTATRTICCCRGTSEIDITKFY